MSAIGQGFAFPGVGSGPGLRLPLAPLDEKTMEFAKLWHQARGEGMVPTRDKLGPAQLRSLLPWVSILELRGPDEIIFRLSGTAMREQSGVELTGLNYLDMTTAENRPIRRERTELECSHPCGAYARYAYHDDQGRLMPFEILSFPLRRKADLAPDLVISISCSPILGHWKPVDPAHPEIPTSRLFRFVDLGAGVPDDPKLISG